MIASVFEHIGLSETHQDVTRNIVSLRISEDLFDDLSADPAAWAAAIALETEAKPPTFKSKLPSIERPFKEAIWNDAIQYPFKNWMRSRYSDGSFGVWYGGDSIETTVAETAHHWRSQLLADAGFLQPGVKIDRNVFQVRLDAALLDLRAAVPHFPALVDPVDLNLTQQIGGKLHREGHPGLLTKSARCAGDTFAVLNPAVLSDPRPVCFLTYTLMPGGRVEIEREPGSVWISA